MASEGVIPDLPSTSAFFMPCADKKYLSGFAKHWKIAAASAIETTPSQFASPRSVGFNVAGVVVVVVVSDVVVVAVGIPHFLDSSLCKEDAIVLDCGIHYLDDGRIVGDVLPSDNVSKLSKVPGGIGTITTSVLMENVLKLYKKQRS